MLWNKFTNKLFLKFAGKKPSVKILNSAGTVFHTIQTNSQEQNLFVRPLYMTLSTDGHVIYVSGYEKHAVTSYSVTGEKLHVYKFGKLKCPTGLTVIENKFLLVCGLGSQNLHEISCPCEHIQIVLDSRDVVGET